MREYDDEYLILNSFASCIMDRDWDSNFGTTGEYVVCKKKLHVVIYMIVRTNRETILHLVDVCMFQGYFHNI